MPLALPADGSRVLKPGLGEVCCTPSPEARAAELVPSCVAQDSHAVAAIGWRGRGVRSCFLVMYFRGQADPVWVALHV